MRSLTVIILFFSLASRASVTVQNVDCPIQFEGRVQEVIKSVGASSPFATQTIMFQNNRTIKGNIEEVVPVQVLEHGPIQVEQGKDYSVQLRNGRVCSIESI